MKINKYNKQKNISGEQIRKLRKENKITQKDLSEKVRLEGINLTAKEISKIETNKRLVQDFELCAIAKVLDVTTDSLLTNFKNYIDKI